jgi:predicted MFS family arabinose efflux permease
MQQSCGRDGRVYQPVLQLAHPGGALFSEYVTLDRHFHPSAGGLLSALIALAGIPGSLLGGYWADRSRNLRMFVVGPLAIVSFAFALLGLTGRNPATVSNRPGAGALAPAGIRAALPFPSVAED